MRIGLYNLSYLEDKQYRVLDEQFDTYREAFLFACGIAQGVDLVSNELPGSTILEKTFNSDEEYFAFLDAGKGSKL